MPARRNLLMGIMLLIGSAHLPASLAFAEDGSTPSAESLSRFYDGLDVERHWIAGQHIDWRSGDPDGRPNGPVGRHTHCSAFVAAAAERLGIYLLRPPEHGQLLLANAQNEWLAQSGPQEGWTALDGALAAQAAANAGRFVVATYRSHLDDRPGHIAIVRPSRKPPTAVSEEGPDVIQAGTRNSERINLRQGFAGHPSAWGASEVRYYAHAVPADRL